MNACKRILSAAVVAWFCTVAWSSGQVGTDGVNGPEGNLNLLVSNDLLAPPGEYRGNDLVFRNRLGGMYFTASADILALERVDNHSFTLLQSGPGGPEALNAGDLYFETRTGPKLNLIVHDILFGCDLELGYMAIDGFSLSKTLYSGDSSLFFDSPILTAEASGGAGIRFDYDSRIQSAEANLRHDLGDRFSLLAGFRYVDLHEQFDGSFTASGPADGRFITSNTDNHLYGFQLGGELTVLRLQKIHVGAIAKAGIFSNQSDLNLYGGADGPWVGGIRGQTAFLGEVNLVGSYLLSESIAVRLGYQAMWLQGVALAVDQLEMPATIGPPGWNPDAKGSLFYHGAYLGVEISF
ncbi:MAG: hypothetical protein IT426_19725 [Pirellulales bacterium]|nr:hypothetical protein [Pirellulales bacterium]